MPGTDATRVQLEAFNKSTNTKIGMWFNKAYVEKKTLSEGFPKVGDFSRVMAADDKEQMDLMQQRLSNAGSGMGFTKIKVGGLNSDAKALPFKDAFGEEAGVVLYTYDVSRADAALSAFSFTMLAIVATMFVISAVLGVSLARRIGKPIAQGDLSQRPRIDGNDEVAQLLGALDRMQASLAELIGAVRSNAESVATASTEIAQGNQDLSGRTEQQASALEETAASMEQLGSTVPPHRINCELLRLTCRHRAEQAQCALIS